MPGRLEWEDNPVRVIDFFVGGLDLPELHFGWVDPRRLAGLTHRSKKELPFTVLHIAGKSPPRLRYFLCGMD
jgi:hypothetical protein